MLNFIRPFSKTLYTINRHNIHITKASGEKVLFSEQKLRASLEKSGADPGMIDEVTGKLLPELAEGISTRKIYRKAFALLKERARSTAAKYKLKQAIMELGPSGYPFEKYIGEILKFQGYQVNVGVLIDGHCITHEVDVVAQKEDEHFMIECKFHNRPGKKTDVKVPLYIQSRFLDIVKHWKALSGHETKSYQGWVVTNTKFTSDAIEYGNCAGLRMIGWNYPKKGSLSDRIALSGLHPLTCLTSLTTAGKQRLLSLDMVLCRDILHHPEVLEQLRLKSTHTRTVLDEVRAICADRN